METDFNQDLEDYWNEYKVLQHTKLLDDSLEEGEDYGSRSCDGKFTIYINIYKFCIIYISKNTFHTSDVIAAFFNGIMGIYMLGNIAIGKTKWGCLEVTADWSALQKRAMCWKIDQWL